MVVKSVSSSQDEILSGIIQLHIPAGIDCDMTYGSGCFWKRLPDPGRKFDIAPRVDGVEEADACALPLEDGSIHSAVCDPPFLTYIKPEADSVMGKRFSGYWSYDQLRDSYQGMINEAHRVLDDGGVFVFKCQDIIHNHRMHCTHSMVIDMAIQCGFRILDLFVLVAKHRMPCKAAPHGRQTQKHARVFHSYFLVFKKTGRSSGGRATKTHKGE